MFKKMYQSLDSVSSEYTDPIFRIYTKRKTLSTCLIMVCLIYYFGKVTFCVCVCVFFVVVVVFVVVFVLLRLGSYLRRRSAC